MKQTAADSLDGSPLVETAPRIVRRSGRRDAIVLTLNRKGRELAYTEGFRALLDSLLADSGTEPERFTGYDWRFAEATRVCESPANTFARPTLPNIIGREPLQILYLFVPPDLVWFDGHFPGDPILPAVIQIDWVLHFAALARDQLNFERDNFIGLSRVKFRSAITPGTILKLRLTKTENMLKYVFESRGGEHSSGEVRFRIDVNSR